MAKIDGKYTPTPFNFQTIDDFYTTEKAGQLKEHIHDEYGLSNQTTILEMLESSDLLIKEYARFLFEKDYSLYTAKQWGVLPSEIDISVLKRVPVVFSYKMGYFDDTYQVMPANGFIGFFKNLVDHSNIDICLNTEAHDIISILDGALYIDGSRAKIPVFYTGAPDELLDYRYGYLPYRSLRFDFKTMATDSFQPAPVIAYPQAIGYTRITEYSKLPVQKKNGKTVIAIEYPMPHKPNTGTEPYYPILTKENASLYDRYRKDLNEIPGLFLCGRLAEYKYYNMDQALENVLSICEKLRVRWA